MSNLFKDVYKQFIACFIVSLPLLIAGTTLGWSSPMMQFIANGKSPVHMSSKQESWMITYIDIGNVVMSIPSGILMDRLGRKYTLLLSIPLTLAGWVLIIIAQQPWYLYVARFLHGNGMAIALIVSPTYVGEISSTSIRGCVSLVLELTYASGLLLSYAVGWMCEYQTLAIVGTAIPVITGILMVFIPESPHYLMMMEKPEAAARSLRALRSYDNEAFKKEMEIIKMSVFEEKSRGQIKMLLNRDRVPLVIVLVLSILQMMSGVGVMEAYASSVLSTNARFSPNASAMIFGAFILLAIVPFALTVDKYGRRPLYITSCVGTTACHVLMAALLSAPSTDLVSWSLLAAFCGAEFFINIGLIPLLCVVQCEYFPPDTRGLANSAVVFTVTVTSTVMMKMYQPVADAYGTSANFVGYAAITFCGAIFCYFWVPETKGKTFKQIQKDFESFTWCHDDKNRSLRT